MSEFVTVNETLALFGINNFAFYSYRKLPGFPKRVGCKNKFYLYRRDEMIAFFRNAGLELVEQEKA